MSIITEDAVEQVALEWLGDLGYEVLHGPDIAPDGSSPERLSYGDVVLVDRLRNALERVNPDLPGDAIEEVIKKVQDSITPKLEEENRRLHLMMTDGVDVEVHDTDGSVVGRKAWLIDFEHVDQNDWLALNQFTVIENQHNRHPHGLPRLFSQQHVAQHGIDDSPQSS